jgi:hypothetical protein
MAMFQEPESLAPVRKVTRVQFGALDPDTIVRCQNGACEQRVRDCSLQRSPQQMSLDIHVHFYRAYVYF